MFWPSLSVRFVIIATSVPLLANKTQIIYNRVVEDFEHKSPERSSSSEDSSSDDSGDAKASTKADTKQSSSSRHDDTKEQSSWFGDAADKAETKQPSLYDLFEQRADPEPPLENLAPDEQTLVTDELSNLHLDAAKQELTGTEPGSPAEAAAIAGATFNEAVREHLENGEAPSEATLDAAMKDTADIMGLDANEIPEDDNPLELSGNEAEGNNDEIDPGVIAEETPPTPPIPPGGTPNQVATTPPSPGGPVAPPPPGAGTPPPPNGPAGPPGGGPPGPYYPGGGGPNNGPMPPMPPIAPTVPWANPNIAGALTGGNTLNHNRRHNHWPYVLAGGVVGYLIGRRRGRIKTEKKLKPVQQKLEQQVGDLQFQLALREAKIRKLAYEKAISHPHIHAALPKRLKELQELQQASREQAKAKQQESSAAEKTNDTQRKKAEKLQKAGLAAKIIQMTERDKPESDSTSESNALPFPRPSLQEIPRAKDMPILDILAVAEQIPLEDETLRMLYETGRISQRGLRRVIEEYLRGGHYDRVLWEELQSGESTQLPSDASPALDAYEPTSSLVVSGSRIKQLDPTHMSVDRQTNDGREPDATSVVPKVAVVIAGVIAIIVFIILFT